jgi:hypothetical protein
MTIDRVRQISAFESVLVPIQGPGSFENGRHDHKTFKPGWFKQDGTTPASDNCSR